MLKLQEIKSKIELQKYKNFLGEYPQTPEYHFYTLFPNIRIVKSLFVFGHSTKISLKG